MQGNSAAIDKYIRSGMSSVAGYLRTVDAKVIATLLGYQEANNYSGNLCEIGVHHGRLFFILALARKNGQHALAIDLFEDDDINVQSQWHSGRDRALNKNAERLKIPISNEEIFKTSSLIIGHEDIIHRAGGPIRFFSVDGGHDYKCVDNDLPLAVGTLTDEGIIAVDDFFNREWPEVTFATYDFLRKTPEIVPFLLSSGKLFLAKPKMAPLYQDAVLKANPDMIRSNVHFIDRDIAFVRYGYSRRIMDLIGDTISKLRHRK
jgi:methyltransferase family protein